MPRPRMIVVAGPPGSGKTRYFPLTAFGVDAFNIDDRCAQILGSYRAIPRDVRRAVAKECERFVLDHIARCASFAVETTLRTTAAIEQAELARRSGFATVMRFVATDSIAGSSRSRAMVASFDRAHRPAGSTRRSSRAAGDVRTARTKQRRGGHGRRHRSRRRPRCRQSPRRAPPGTASPSTSMNSMSAFAAARAATASPTTSAPATALPISAAIAARSDTGHSSEGPRAAPLACLGLPATSLLHRDPARPVAALFVAEVGATEMPVSPFETPHRSA